MSRPGAASELRPLEDFLDQLHVALGDMRIYGPRHRVTLERVRTTWEKLGGVLASFGPLQLISSVDGLVWDGALVRPEDDQRPGIGRLLHQEGIRSLTFEPGVAHKEFVTLLDVLRINLSLPEHEEETLDSLLWQAGLQNITARALEELEEAEVLSGQAWLRGNADMAGQVIRELLDIRVDEGTTRGRLQAPMTEGAVQRAIAESDLTGLGGEGAGARLVDQGAWANRLNTEGARDYEVLVRERDAVAGEGPGGLLARLVLLLARVALSDRPELPAGQALSFARQATDEIFRRTLPGGLLEVLEGLPGVGDTMYTGGRVVRHELGVLAEELAQPTRVSRMLLDLDPARHTDEEGLRRLVGWMPDAALEQVLEMAARDGTDERGRWLLEILGTAAQPRFEAWLDDLERQPQARVVALIGLLRGLESDAGRNRRLALMKHPSRDVRIAVLGWYVDDLPKDEVDALLPSLADRHAGVRRAARAVVVRHRATKAYTWLRLAVTGDVFPAWDADRKRDVCISLGAVGGDLAVDVLRELLGRKTSMFGQKDEGADLVAAALGLAATGTLEARMALKKGASALNRQKRAACQQALAQMERGR